MLDPTIIAQAQQGDLHAFQQRNAEQRMLPRTPPAPSLLPYLSSAEVGWDGLVAQAFRELPEMDGYKQPGETYIVLTLLTGGGRSGRCGSCVPTRPGAV